MKFSICMVGVSLITMLVTGCSPELAQTQLGDQEQQWESAIRKSYPSWRPPRVAPPAIKDNMSPKYVPQTPAADTLAVPVEESVAVEEVTTVDTDQVVDAPATDIPPAAASDDVNVAATEAVAPAVEPKDEVAVDATSTIPAVEAPVVEQKKVEYSEYTVVAGDSLSKIARKVYKDGRRYFVILQANEDQLKNNPNYLYPGMKLRIPKL